MDHMCSIPPHLESSLLELGILPPTKLQELEEVLDPRRECMKLGYYRSPYDENGDLLF